MNMQRSAAGRFVPALTWWIWGLLGAAGAFSAGHATAVAPNGMPAGMDCEQMARMPGMPMSVESCKKLMGAQQAYDAALADPSAARPGDDKMGCEQIMAELKQQRYTAPDKAKVAEGQAAAAAEQKTLAKQQAETTRTVAEQSAAVAAASAKDLATEAATAGVVRPRTAAVLEQEFQRQNKVTGERMAEERRPHEQRLMSTTGDFAADAGQQISQNPRLARLIQLANQKNCKDR
jgi:hypothetical protein